MTHYDDALPAFVDRLVTAGLSDRIRDPFEWRFLRDASGRVSVILPDATEERVRNMVTSAAKGLEPWIDQRLPYVLAGDLEQVRATSATQPSLEYVSASGFETYVSVIEHRLVGQDWLRTPVLATSIAPPRVVFASQKGGVGRSTALAVAAVDLAQTGQNVLVIDLDLEAPGLGRLLLNELPRFGALDYLAESSLIPVPDTFLDGMVLARDAGAAGLVDVVPAFGTASLDNPQNVLGKIARAYIEYVDAEGTAWTLFDRVRTMVDNLCARRRYDCVLIDSRAGLNEAGSAAILGLGATILLFATDSPQTFDAYRFLLGHLARFRAAGSGDSDWRYQLRFVHAKADARNEIRDRFRDRLGELCAETIYDLAEPEDQDPFSFDLHDETAPHHAWPILDDTNYRSFDPLEHPHQLTTEVYQRTFGSFLGPLKMALGIANA